MKTFRLKRDAEEWVRRTEDEMVRGLFMQRGPSERMTFEKAVNRYLAKVTPTKRPFTQIGEKRRTVPLTAFFGKYSLAGITPELVAEYRDKRLAGEDRTRDGKPKPRASNTVRLELTLIGHLFNIAIKEWGLGLAVNPVLYIRRPSPGAGRNRRLAEAVERRLMALVDRYSNSMMRWIVRFAIETSMRSSESTGPRKGQVDIGKRVVRLLETKNTMPRTVPLTKVATKLFREALANPLRPKGCDLVFFGEAGLRNLRFHDLRHQGVSRLVEAGLSDKEVSAVSGHRSMQMLKRYTHLRAELLHTASSEIGTVQK